MYESGLGVCVRCCETFPLELCIHCGGYYIHRIVCDSCCEELSLSTDTPVEEEVLALR